MVLWSGGVGFMSVGIKCRREDLNFPAFRISVTYRPY